MSFPDLTDGTVRLADHVRDGDRETFTVVRDGAAVGTVELHHVGAGTGRLVWRLGKRTAVVAAPPGPCACSPTGR